MQVDPSVFYSTPYLFLLLYTRSVLFCLLFFYFCCCCSAAIFCCLFYLFCCSVGAQWYRRAGGIVCYSIERYSMVRLDLAGDAGQLTVTAQPDGRRLLVALQHAGCASAGVVLVLVRSGRYLVHASIARALSPYTASAEIYAAPYIVEGSVASFVDMLLNVQRFCKNILYLLYLLWHEYIYRACSQLPAVAPASCSIALYLHRTRRARRRRRPMNGRRRGRRSPGPIFWRWKACCLLPFCGVHVLFWSSVDGGDGGALVC